ncbi:MAG TPA: hypothetical protein VIK99_08150 [Thermaerobacter sp.]
MDERDSGAAGAAGQPGRGGAGALPPDVARWRPRVPGDRLLLPEPWLDVLARGAGGVGQECASAGPPVGACVAYRVEKPAGAPPAAPGAGRAPGAAEAPWPRVLLAPVDGDEAAALLAGAGAGAPAPAPAGASFDGVLLAHPADLDRLLVRRPDLTRPRGGRPCWVLLLFRRDDAPGPWARGWARVVAWAPGALPPVVVPAELVNGGEPVPADRLRRARQALLRALEEPVPVAVARRWRGTGHAATGHPAGAEVVGEQAVEETVGEEAAPRWWLVS